MDIGMLWFDNSNHKLEEKVKKAVEHYKAKYSQTPTVCFVNPKTLNGGPEAVGGVQIRGARTVLPNHFWIGVGEATVGANGHRKGNSGKGRN